MTTPDLTTPDLTTTETIAPAWSSDLLPDLDAPLARLVLAIADDELVTGHRASHWTGVAPSLEADLAFSTIAQDEVNHADVWYSLLVDREAADARSRIDAIGLGRVPSQYRHAVLCERPPGDFIYSLARHWAYDHADVVRLGALADSSHTDVAAVSEKLLREERYHLLHADHWFERLSGGVAGDVGRGRDELAAALQVVLPEALWLFEPIEGEDELVSLGLLPRTAADLRDVWLEGVSAALRGVGLSSVLPTDLAPAYDAPGGRRGVHTEDFDLDIWPEMTALYRAHPGAVW